MSFSPNLSIYPAHAGINLIRYLTQSEWLNLPRTCGDKPVGMLDNLITLVIYPAHGGINR